MAQMETDIQDPEVDILYCCPFTKQSPAHFQCVNGNVKLLKLLIKHNPEIALKLDDDGNTLLHALVKVIIIYFISYQNVDSKLPELLQIIKILKEADAFNPGQENSSGKKAIDIVRKRKQDKN